MKKYSFKEISTCEMCGSDSKNHKILGQRLNSSQGFKPRQNIGISVSILKCTNCNLIYSSPQPIPDDIQDHYGAPPEDYWKDDYFHVDKNYFKRQIDTASKLLDFKPGMKALDIGTGIGKGMLAMEAKGFDVYGLEPSIPFHERAISKMGISKDRIKLGAIEELDYDNDSFDFITFSAVFEHMYEPSACLERALKWLKPNGVIHLEVPSSKWLLPFFINTYFKLIGVNYVTNLSPMHNPFHLHEFDLKSFEELSKKLGFKIEHYYYDVAEIYFFPKVFHGLLRFIMEKTNKGMQLTVYLRKT